MPAPTAPRSATSFSVLVAAPPRAAPPYTTEGVGGRTTWEALLRDGLVDEVHAGFGVLAGTLGSPQARARSLTTRVPREIVVGRRSAAWVHTGGRRPDKVSVLYAPHGYRPRDAPHLEIAQATMRSWESQTLGGVQVTTPERTALDVATWCDDDSAHTVLVRLAHHGVDLEDAVVRLTTHAHWRSAERARARLLRAVGAASAA
jgi:hypothetical protein